MRGCSRLADGAIGLLNCLMLPVGALLGFPVPFDDQFLDVGSFCFCCSTLADVTIGLPSLLVGMSRSDSLKFCGVVESPPTPGSLTALLQFHNVVEIAADAPIGQPVDDFHSDVATAVVNLFLIAADVAIGQL